MVYNMHRDFKYNGHPRLHVQLHAEGESDNSYCGHGGGRKQNKEFNNTRTEIRVGQVSSKRSVGKLLLGIYSHRVAR